MAASAPLAQEEPQSAGKHLRNQLAAAVRSINWSYAIFWSISSSHSGSLTWKDGFYNGETKTRRITNSSPELTSNQLVMQRSEQLRELYESLLSGNCDHRAARPVISLSLEDLADGEWYYLVCMTYTFRPWQGLPGRCLASNDHVWLCNAHLADSETFLRALLAKSAAIQTIVCIPLMGGVLELGTTFSVPENTDLVNRVTASLKELQYGTCTDAPSANLTGQADNAIVLLDDLDENGMETMIAEGQHETGEVDCLFNTNLEQITKETGDFYGLWEELDVQPLENSWIMDEGLSDSPRMTSFMAWTMPGSDELAVPVIREPQKLLKKVVSGGSWTNSGDVNTEIVERIVQESSIRNHVMSERRRRGKLNEMFLILKSLAPAINKMDKASILAGAIAYLKELEQKVQELESISRPAGKAMLMCHDNEITGMSLSAANKRKKASELSGDMEEREHHWELSKDGSSNVINVSIMGTDVVVQVQCRWKELLMVRVFDAIKNLHLDVLSVQASTPDGLFGLKIKAQFSSSATFAPGIIREALQNAIN